MWVAGNPAGLFEATPRGVILHGTRSGRAWDIAREFEATVGYVRSGADGLGWNATLGENQIAIHLPESEWGWNARAASPHYLAVEFAQATAEQPIADGQIQTFVWWLRMVRRIWPDLPLSFPTHAELEAGGETGQWDGKSDIFPNGDPRSDELRRRILAAL